MIICYQEYIIYYVLLMLLKEEHLCICCSLLSISWHNKSHNHSITEVVSSSWHACTLFIMQVLRSVGDWSAGIATKDNSILQAIVHSIDFSEHFIYMEVPVYVTMCMYTYLLDVFSHVYSKRSSFSYHICPTKGFTILLLKQYARG